MVALMPLISPALECSSPAQAALFVVFVRGQHAVAWLQGHKLVALSAALTSSQAVLDAVGSCIVFLLLSSRLPASLPSLGWVTLGTSLAALVAGSQPLPVP